MNTDANEPDTASEGAPLDSVLAADTLSGNLVIGNAVPDTSAALSRVLQAGDPGNPVVLVLHTASTAGGNLDDWHPMLARLGAHFRCLAPDLSNLSGQASGPPDTKTPAAGVLSAPVLGLLDELGVSRLTVIGSGHAGVAALRLAELVPKRITALILTGFPSHSAVSEDQHLTTPDRLANFVRPTLVMRGRNDDDAPLEASIHLSTHIPRADLYLLPGSGHAVHLAQPERFATAVHDFARRCGN